ncbi:MULTISPECIES: hypothetical protein [unclassified Streptomyces]|uniref:hypothetical protein n=1 Tax=unclassified Streptomyces TaxID=2593676 RepID=UPI002442F762|nr:hypothetical protein [Streptomyces sp. DH41]MDG9728517.1 hypothetical protein [Streptomyces sp. DH41]
MVFDLQEFNGPTVFFPRNVVVELQADRPVRAILLSSQQLKEGELRLEDVAQG